MPDDQKDYIKALNDLLFECNKKFFDAIRGHNGEQAQQWSTAILAMHSILDREDKNRKAGH